MERNATHQGPMNVRLKPETRRRLKKVSSRTGVKMSQLIRTAVDSKLPEWEKTGIRIPA